MGDLEFDILDELYFVKTYKDLKKNISCSEQELKIHLTEMISKEWIRILDHLDKEVSFSPLIFDEVSDLKLIATKKGLLAHNQV